MGRLFKLTAEDKENIRIKYRAAKANRVTLETLAEEYGVTKQWIAVIIRKPKKRSTR